MSDDKWIEVEGDKPKVEPTRRFFTELRASLQNARAVEMDLRHEFDKQARRIEALEARVRELEAERL